MNFSKAIRNRLNKYCNSNWYNLSHIHMSLLGIKDRDIELIIKIEKYVREKLAIRLSEFQTWIMIDVKNSDYDCIYVHSVNPYSDYPYEFEKGRVTTINSKIYLPTIKTFKENNFEVFKVKNFTSIIAMLPNKRMHRTS
jgi:hypothetical protein